MVEQIALRLHQLPPSLKVLITFFLVWLAVGYGVASLQIFAETGFEVEGTARHYHGGLTEEEKEIHLPPTFKTLLTTSHVHTFSQPILFGLVGFLFVLTPLSELAKILFISLGFVGSLVSNGVPWLIRYVSPHWTFLFPLAELLMIGSFFVMFFVILLTLWLKKEEEEDV